MTTTMSYRALSIAVENKTLASDTVYAVIDADCHMINGTKCPDNEEFIFFCDELAGVAEAEAVRHAHNLADRYGWRQLRQEKSIRVVYFNVEDTEWDECDDLLIREEILTEVTDVSNIVNCDDIESEYSVIVFIDADKNVMLDTFEESSCAYDVELVGKYPDHIKDVGAYIRGIRTHQCHASAMLVEEEDIENVNDIPAKWSGWLYRCRDKDTHRPLDVIFVTEVKY